MIPSASFVSDVSTIFFLTADRLDVFFPTACCKDTPTTAGHVSGTTHQNLVDSQHFQYELVQLREAVFNRSNHNNDGLGRRRWAHGGRSHHLINNGTVKLRQLGRRNLYFPFCPLLSNTIYRRCKTQVHFLFYLPCCLAVAGHAVHRTKNITNKKTFYLIKLLSYAPPVTQ